MKVAVLSGGVGGARFLRGLLGVVDPGAVTIVGNVGDDLELLGLRVSPDLDSILYTLTGRSDDDRGWGRADESWRALETVDELGGEAWFRLGDRDLGLHLVRTELLRSGASLSEATARVAAAPLPIAIPRSASFSASASFTPSPVIATTCPRRCSAFTMARFW